MNSSIFPWKTLAIASAALIILFIGGFLISGTQPVQSKQTTNAHKATAVAENIVPVAAKSEPTSEVKLPVTKPQPPPHKKAIKKAAYKATETPNNPVEETTPLDEMVVMGIADQHNKIAIDSVAHPKIGWTNYENYLRERAIAADGKAGTVKVAFTVNPNGTCTDFKVKSGLTKSVDQKAVELIKNGSMWIGNADGSASETIVDVKFHE